MVLDGQKVKAIIDGKDGDWNSLSTSWRGDDGKIGSVRAVPRFHLIPLYPKVRIHFEFIRDVVMRFDKFLREAIYGSKPISSLTSPFEWDIFLSTVNQFKSAIHMESQIENSVKRRILLYNMPRFIWCAKMRYDGRALLELVFDATDIEQGKFFVHSVKYNDSIYSLLRKVSKILLSDPYYQSKLYYGILGWFATRS